MPALGQKETSRQQIAMSDLPPESGHSRPMNERLKKIHDPVCAAGKVN
jgi:hypothetical protein